MDSSHGPSAWSTGNAGAAPLCPAGEGFNIKSMYTEARDYGNTGGCFDQNEQHSRGGTTGVFDAVTDLLLPLPQN